MSTDEAKIRSAVGDKYEIKGHISSGGMGDIYLGVHRALERRVAIKIIHQELSADEELRKRFLREARLAASLDHPAMIDIYDFGSKDDFDYIIMPYIEGKTLQEKLKAEGKLSLQESLRLMIVLADALAYAHNSNVVHRDVKPSNIMIDNEGHFILTDFGISKDLKDTGLTMPRGVLGSPKYMSPEQIKGIDVDGRSDLYSLGLLFYEMVTGKHPFEGKDATALCYCQTSEMPPRPEECISDLPAEVGDIIMRLLEKTPEQRYQNAEELLKALEGCSPGRSQASRMDVDATLVAPQVAADRTEPQPAEALPKGMPQKEMRDSPAAGASQPAGGFSIDKRIKKWILPALGVTLVLAAGIVWVTRSSPIKETVPVQKDSQVPASADLEENLALLSKGTGGVSESAIETGLSPVAESRQSIKPSFDSIVERLMALAQGTEAAFLQLWLEKARFSIGDSISYHFRSDKSCYLVALNVTSGGELIQVFPNRFSPSQFVQANKEYRIPGEQLGIELQVSGPAGKEEIVALVAEAPFDLLSATFEDDAFFQVDKEDPVLLETISKNIQTAEKLNMVQKRVSYAIVD